MQNNDNSKQQHMCKFVLHYYLGTLDMVVKVVAESMYHIDCVVANFELEMTRKQH